MSDQVRVCPCCHTDDVEVVRGQSYGYVAICAECGYARKVSRELLLAS